MKTNLIFKRQVTLNGVTKTVTRIVPVEIPQIESGEGWLLSGHTDCIETTEEMVTVIKIVKSDEKELQLDFDGDIRVFNRAE